MRDSSGDQRLAAATLTRRGWLAQQPQALSKTILESVQMRRVPRGSAVFRRGEDADGIYGLVSGRVKFRTCTSDGREIVSSAKGPGAWFGEVGVFDGLPRGQDAIALGPVIVALFPVARFRQLTEDNPRYLRNFAEIMTQNMRGISFLAAEVSPELPPARVLRLIGFLLREDVRQARGGAVILDVGQDLLASIAGLSRQTVNRELSRLAATGLLERRYGRVIVDAELLRRSATMDPVDRLPASA